MYLQERQDPIRHTFRELILYHNMLDINIDITFKLIHMFVMSLIEIKIINLIQIKKLCTLFSNFQTIPKKNCA